MIIINKMISREVILDFFPEVLQDMKLLLHWQEFCFPELYKNQMTESIQKKKKNTRGEERD